MKETLIEELRGRVLPHTNCSNAPLAANGSIPVCEGCGSHNRELAGKWAGENRWVTWWAEECWWGIKAIDTLVTRGGSAWRGISNQEPK